MFQKIGSSKAFNYLKLMTLGSLLLGLSSLTSAATSTEDSTDPSANLSADPSAEPFITPYSTEVKSHERINTEAYDLKKYNFRLTSARGLGLHFDHELTSAWMLGYSLTTETAANTSFGKVEESLVGIEGNFFFNRNHQVDGWMGTLFTKVGRAKLRELPSHKFAPGSKTSSLVSQVGVLVGYQWIWESFNIQLSGGVASRNLAEPLSFQPRISDIPLSTQTWSEDGFYTPLQLSFGWAF